MAAILAYILGATGQAFLLSWRKSLLLVPSFACIFAALFTALYSFSSTSASLQDISLLLIFYMLLLGALVAFYSDNILLQILTEETLLAIAVAAIYAFFEVLNFELYSWVAVVWLLPACFVVIESFSPIPHTIYTRVAYLFWFLAVAFIYLWHSIAFESAFLLFPSAGALSYLGIFEILLEGVITLHLLTCGVVGFGLVFILLGGVTDTPRQPWIRFLREQLHQQITPKRSIVILCSLAGLFLTNAIFELLDPTLLFLLVFTFAVERGQLEADPFMTLHER